MTGIRRARKVRPPPLACDNWQWKECTRFVLGSQYVLVRVVGTGPFPTLLVPFEFYDWSPLARLRHHAGMSKAPKITQIVSAPTGLHVVWKEAPSGVPRVVANPHH